MNIKRDILTFLVGIPGTSTVRERKAFLTVAGCNNLEGKMALEGNSFVFFNDLIDIVGSDGKKGATDFLRKLLDGDFLSLDRRQILKELLTNIELFDEREWNEIFLNNFSPEYFIQNTHKDKNLDSKREDLDLLLKIPEVTHEDIDFIITGLVKIEDLSPEVLSDFECPTIKEPNIQTKISKNQLSYKVQKKIAAGLAQAREVKQVIRSISSMGIPKIAEKVIRVLKTEYGRLVELGMRNDVLFSKMHEFVSANAQDFDSELAALAVLCYFFHTCDVFES